MAARKGTILSDEHILKECAHYRPIPMKLAARIIDENSVVAKESPFSNKKLKYQRQMSRPEHFDSYAHSLSRNLGNDPEFRGRLHTAYNADIAQHHNDVPEAPQNDNVPDAFFMNNVLPILQELREGPLNPNVPEAAPEPDRDDDAFEGSIIDSEDGGPPELEEDAHVPEEENENEPVPKRNEPGPSNYASAKKMRVRETQFLPKVLPKANVSGIKLRSGTQLQGPMPKKQQGLGPNDAQFPTTVYSTIDPFDTPVRTSDIEHTFKKRMALFDFEQQRLAAAKQQRPNSTDTPQ